MRLIVWTSALLALSIGGASASSFVSVAPPKSSPSIITLSGAPRPPENVALLASPPPDLLPESVARPEPAKLFSISPSVVAFQGLEPRVTSEKVAGVKHPLRPFVPSTPMVIRGGIAGDPFGTAKPPVTEAVTAGTAGKPGPVQAKASGKGVNGGQEPQSRTDQPATDQQTPDQARSATPAPPSRVVKPR